MFLLIASLSKPVEEVALQAEAHSVWVRKYIQEGVFLMAGSKKSKLGGAILTKSISKDLLLKILAEDSYVIADVADYQIIDFDCKLTMPELEVLKTC